MNKKTLIIVCLVCFAVALMVRIGLAYKLGMARPMESDSHYYLQLATSLAHGQGYVAPDGFWPNVPSMQRLPGWPFAVSLALRIVPFVSSDVVMRGLCVGIDSINAMLIAWLAWRLFARSRVALIAGVAYAVHPSALFLAYNGESEPLFVLLCLGGFLCVLHDGRRAYLAVLLFGLACLVRVNYVLWGGAIVMMAVLRWISGRRPSSRVAVSRSVVSCLVSLVLFSLPVTLWAVRNHHVCGHFPVLSTLRGQTFYGGNNPVVADTLKMWGYWVFPDEISGEPKAAELARSMSEYELDVYYYDQGKRYVANEWFSLPRLLLGKMIRAYVPVPWKPNWLSYGVGAFRMILYALSVMGLCWFWRGLRLEYRVWFGAMTIINVLTVLMFWGCFRFAFALEPFLLPFAAAAAERLASRREVVL
jgi:hypothetical protein